MKGLTLPRRAAHGRTPREPLGPEPRTGGETNAAGEHRPVTVTLALLLGYAEGAIFLALGTRNPEDGNGGHEGAGIFFIVVGVLVLGLTTLARTGSRLARACLLIPVVGAGVVLVRDRDLDTIWRVLPVAAAALLVVLLTLLPPSRRWYGDDGTTLGTP